MNTTDDGFDEPAGALPADPPRKPTGQSAAKPPVDGIADGVADAGGVAEGTVGWVPLLDVDLSDGAAGVDFAAEVTRFPSDRVSGSRSPGSFEDDRSGQELSSGIFARPRSGDSATPHDDGMVIPETLGGYQVGRRIGRGGMGEVFLAEHKSMGRQVALKILPSKWLGRSDSVERFYEEIRAASRLLHPNIVTAFDAGQAEGIHFLAMEYVDGQTLTQIVAGDGPMPIGDAASAIRQASFALHHAHAAGIVHRDVKPGNLMRGKDGTIKLLDLGLARMAARRDAVLNAPVQPMDPRDADSSRQSGDPLTAKERRGDSPRAFVGTLSYISPEQLEESESADHRSDQYSLGATLFYLLTGRPPFVGELIDQVYGHRHGQIPDLMRLRSDVDLTLSHIVRRMLAKNPGERYGSMDEIARAMAPYDNDRSTPAWVLDFARREINDEGSTATGESTHRTTLRVMGIELGMTHACTAMTVESGDIEVGLPGRGESGGKRLFRMAVANQPSPDGDADRGAILFGDTAYEQRSRYPERVAHCQMMYFGRDDMLRRIGDRMCPPEVTTAMCLRRLVGNTLTHTDVPGGDDPLIRLTWKRHPRWPDAVAITVPSNYDQTQRRAILSAARLAGLPSIRLIDRGLATVRASLLNRETGRAKLPGESGARGREREKFLYVGLTGQSLDISVVSHHDGQLEQMASSGRSREGSMAWSSRLVELIAAQIPDAPQRIRKSPTSRRELVHAAKIQIAGERAMNALLLTPQTKFQIEHGSRRDEVSVTREHWLAACDDLIESISAGIASACRDASIVPSDVDHIVAMGPILRLPAIRDRVFGGIGDASAITHVDHVDAARGAASCVAAELPGHRQRGLPTRTNTSRSIGFVIADQTGRRKILPIIPRGTPTPARTNRNLAGTAKNHQLTLSLVESTGGADEAWQTLGRHAIDVAADESRPTRHLGFEIDINGLLSVHLERPELGRTVILPPLPASQIREEDWLDWREWIDANT